MKKMKKMKLPVELTMDMILKMTPEVFRDTVKAQNLGFQLSLQNLLKAQFEQCNMSREVLVQNVASGKVPDEDMEQHDKTIRDLYLCMQLIEDRHNILAEITKVHDKSGDLKH